MSSLLSDLSVGTSVTCCQLEGNRCKNEVGRYTMYISFTSSLEAFFLVISSLHGPHPYATKDSHQQQISTVLYALNIDEFELFVFLVDGESFPSTSIVLFPKYCLWYPFLVVTQRGHPQSEM